MSDLKLKSKVIDRLQSINDAYLFEEILGYLNNESIDNIVNIPAHYKEQLDNSIAQKKAGNTIPNSEVEKSIKLWLYK